MLEPTSETSVWSAGMPLAGSRSLTEGERLELQARAGAFRRKGLLALAFIPVLFVLFLGAALALNLPARGGLSLPLILVTVATPLLMLTARDCLTLARELQRDGVSGRADRFEGTVGHVTSIDSTLQRLVRAGLIHKGGSDLQWFEVLPASGVVWQANGTRPERWIRAAYSETANLPTYAGIAAEWVESVDASREDAFHLGRRDLSGAELEELRRHLRRLTLKPAVLGVILNAWLVAAVWALLTGARHLTEGHEVFLFAVLVAVTVQVDINLGRCLILGGKFLKDLRLRTAVIVRSPALLPRQPDPSGVTLLPPDEFLAISGVLWTRGGAPAPWRLMPGR